jgi:Cache 3/Cache 2 fusion domain
MLRAGKGIAFRAVKLFANKALVILVIAIGFPVNVMLVSSAANAQEARTARSMQAFKDRAAKLGAPRIQGEEEVGGKTVPVLYFGSTKANNDFTLVDEVTKEDPGTVATLFVKVVVQQRIGTTGEEFIRVATTVLLPDGRRGVGTAMGSPALESIKAGQPYHGEVEVLGARYITDYEPIKDASGETIGAYFVGYKK